MGSSASFSDPELFMRQQNHSATTEPQDTDPTTQLTLEGKVFKEEQVIVDIVQEEDLDPARSTPRPSAPPPQHVKRTGQHLPEPTTTPTNTDFGPHQRRQSTTLHRYGNTRSHIPRLNLRYLHHDLS